MNKGVILLSGGLDSATAAAIARRQCRSVHALTITYGQRHAVELQAAAAVARHLALADHRVISVDLRALGGSALTDAIDVPKHQSEASALGAIPVTYVPARNLIFLSLAVAYAETIGATELFLGVNAVDFSGYPDCRPEFIAAFERVATVGTKSGAEGRPFRIHAPLMEMTKAEIIRTGVELGVDFGMTHSCYDPSMTGEACGACDSCVFRRRGFEEAGVPDPTRYAKA